MLINFYCFTSHVYYFWFEIYDKTIIKFSLWFFPLEMYNGNHNSYLDIDNSACHKNLIQ